MPHPSRQTLQLPSGCGPRHQSATLFNLSLGLGLHTPPLDPSTLILGCGPRHPTSPARPLNSPPWVWARHPQADPSTPHLGVGLDTPLARPLNFPPGCWPRHSPARPLNFPHRCGPRHPPSQTPQLTPGYGPRYTLVIPKASPPTPPEQAPHP